MVSKSRRSVIKHRKKNKSTRKVQVRKPIRLKIKRKSTIKTKGKGKGKAKKSKKRSRSKKRKLRGGSPVDDETDSESEPDEAGSSDEDTDDETTLLPDQSRVRRTGRRRRVPAHVLRPPVSMPDAPPAVQYSIELGPDGQPLLPDNSPAEPSQLEERLRAAQQEPWERMERDLADFQRHLQEREQLAAALPLPPTVPPTQGQRLTAEQQARNAEQFNRLRGAQGQHGVPDHGGHVFPLPPVQTGMREGPLPSLDNIRQRLDALRREPEEPLPTYDEVMRNRGQGQGQGQGSESESE